MHTILDMKSHEWAKHERVIVFDGVCNWCNFWVNFTINHDSAGKFKFGMLQSEPAQAILKQLDLSTDDFDTFLLIEHHHLLSKSTAVLNVVRYLSGFWPLFYLGIVIPRPIRDWLYDRVARNRYRLMGKSAMCRIPTPSERGWFV